MKRTVYILLIICCAIMFSGCGEKAEDNAVKAENTSTAICSVDNLSTWLPRGEDSNEFESAKIPLPVGTAVTLLDEERDGKIGEITIKMQKIRTSDNKEVWANQRYIVPGGSLGVLVANDVLLYNEPDITKMTSTLLAKGQLVGVYPEAEGQFRKISGWNNAKRTGFSDQYVKADVLSLKENDTSALILLERSKKEKDATVKTQILKTAAGLMSPAFGLEIDEMLSRIQDKPQAESSQVSLPDRPFEDFSIAGTINSNDVRVRDYPYETGTQIISKLNTGDEIQIIQKTVQSYTVGNDNSPWFKISEPEGWVFGIFIDF